MAEGEAKATTKRRLRKGKGETSARGDRKVEGAAPLARVKAAPDRGKQGQRIFLLIAASLLLLGALYALSVTDALMMAALMGLLALLLRGAPAKAGLAGEPRRIIGAGSVMLLLGLALVGTGVQEAGIGTTLLALFVLMFGIHTFGRLGPEESVS
jgi:hypothetical protein